MPRFEDRKDRKQAAVCWFKNGVDSDGEVAVAAPLSLMVRWVDTKNKTQAPNTSTIGYDATLVLDRVVPLDSLFWLGSFTCMDTTSGDVLPDVYQLKKLTLTEDLKGRITRYEGGLMRYRDVSIDFLLSGVLFDYQNEVIVDEDGDIVVQTTSPLASSVADENGEQVYDEVFEEMITG